MRLCPQQYSGIADMQVVPCTNCPSGWSTRLRRCEIYTGAEGFPPAPVVPSCPIQDRCQHQLQNGEVPCVVRASGQVCESALIYSGMSVEDAKEHPLSFNADDL
jgi:hypothetical protein